MVYEHSDYRSFLKATLLERSRKNPAYSMRSMARQTGLSASSLSDILKGHKNLSPTRALTVASLLGLDPPEAEFFGLLVQSQASESPDVRARLEARMRALSPRPVATDLSLDHFQMIAEWVHLPILEMTFIPGPPLTAALISERLGISRIEAELALERLERLELIEKDKKGRYQKSTPYWIASSKVPNEALRRFHAQML